MQYQGQNSEYHWAAFFDNGRRVEIYPTTLGIQEAAGKPLSHGSVEDIISEAERVSKLPSIEREKFSVIEDFDSSAVKGGAVAQNVAI